MADRVLVPLPDGRWLALQPDTFREGLAAGDAAMGRKSGGAPRPGEEPHPSEEPLMDAAELSRSLNLPKSCVYERARNGDFPSVRVGKHLRFRRSAVLAALGVAAPQAAGHP
jgi:excisionase family DNA binding protein